MNVRYSSWRFQVWHDGSWHNGAELIDSGVTCTIAEKLAERFNRIVRVVAVPASYDDDCAVVAVYGEFPA